MYTNAMIKHIIQNDGHVFHLSQKQHIKFRNANFSIALLTATLVRQNGMYLSLQFFPSSNINPLYKS